MYVNIQIYKYKQRPVKRKGERERERHTHTHTKGGEGEKERERKREGEREREKERERERERDREKEREREKDRERETCQKYVACSPPMPFQLISSSVSVFDSAGREIRKSQPYGMAHMWSILLLHEIDSIAVCDLLCDIDSVVT